MAFTASFHSAAPVAARTPSKPYGSVTPSERVSSAGGLGREGPKWFFSGAHGPKWPIHST